MTNQTTFHQDKLKFSGNHKLRLGIFIMFLMMSASMILNSLNKELTTNRIIIISLAAIGSIGIIILLIIGDFSGETDIKNIKKIRLYINLFGNVIIRIRNKKGKIREISLGQNYREVSDYLDFAKRNNLPINFDEKKFSQIINEH